MPKLPPPPPTPPPLVRAGKTLANMALNDSDAFVRYRAGEAMSNFGTAVKEQVKAMARTTLKDNDALARSRASEALGFMGERRAEHALTFSELIASSNSRPASRCSTAEIVAQHRALNALRDLGTAAHPFRTTLDSIREGSRDAGVREAARRTMNDLDTRPFGFLGGRIVKSPQASAFPSMTLFASDSILRAEAANLRVEARCSTAAGRRSEDYLFMQAKLMA